MRFLVAEKLGPHKFKTPEGYLICTDAILSRTGKQEYKRCELFGDTCEDPDKIVNVERTDDEVFSDKAMASFENQMRCVSSTLTTTSMLKITTSLRSVLCVIFIRAKTTESLS